MRTLFVSMMALLLVGCVSVAKPRVADMTLVPGGINVYVEFDDVRSEAHVVHADVSSGPLLYQGTEIKLSQDVRDYVRESFKIYLVDNGYGIAPSPATADKVVRGKVLRFDAKLGVWNWYGDVVLEVSVNDGSPVMVSGQGSKTNWGMGDTAEYACDALDEALSRSFVSLDKNL